MNRRWMIWIASVFVLGAVLWVLTVSVVLSQLEAARRSRCEALVALLNQALRMYRTDCGIDPPSHAVIAWLERTGPKGKYFEFKSGQEDDRGRLLDPWGRPFLTRTEAQGPIELYSAGPNGLDEGGHGDDVTP